jgi:hypothetical protein
MQSSAFAPASASGGEVSGHRLPAVVDLMRFSVSDVTGGAEFSEAIDLRAVSAPKH